MKIKGLGLFSEIMGISPLNKSLKETKIALMGAEDVPSSKFDLSSLKQLHPKISPKLWFGKPYLEKTVIISNLFNHTPTPIENGWSVAKTQTRDFRGKSLAYNSHNAIDFAITVGTKVCTAAPGVVLKIHREFNRGGLKIHIDHGYGLITGYVHLAKSLVKVGEKVKRGQVIALSGYSGLDGASTFPFGIPHVHFNTWLNGKPTEAFAFENNISLWREDNMPKSTNSYESDFAPSIFNEDKINLALSYCITKSSVDRINSIQNITYKAIELLVEMNYYPTRFTKFVNIYDKEYPRKSLLDLPFLAEDFNDVVFLDEI